MRNPGIKKGLTGTLLGIPTDKLRFDQRTYDLCQKHHATPMYGCPVCFLLLLADRALAEAAEPILEGLAQQYDKQGKATGMPELLTARDQLNEILGAWETGRQAAMACIINPRGEA